MYDDAATSQNIVSETKAIINKDVWITEVGRPSAPISEGFSPETQYLFLKSNFQTLGYLRIPVFWYELKDEPNAFPEREKYFGLLDSQNNPKAASNVFIEFTSQP